MNNKVSDLFIIDLYVAKYFTKFFCNTVKTSEMVPPPQKMKYYLHSNNIDLEIKKEINLIVPYYLIVAGSIILTSLSTCGMTTAFNHIQLHCGI